MAINNAIVITEEVWANSQLSIARHTWRVKIDGHTYVIVDKLGRDVYECSRLAEMEGRDYAIEPGEPADLCRSDFVPLYRQLGREGFLLFLDSNPDLGHLSIAGVMKRLKKWMEDTNG